MPPYPRILYISHKCTASSGSIVSSRRDRHSSPHTSRVLLSTADSWDSKGSSGGSSQEAKHKIKARVYSHPTYTHTINIH